MKNDPLLTEEAGELYDAIRKLVFGENHVEGEGEFVANMLSMFDLSEEFSPETKVECVIQDTIESAILATLKGESTVESEAKCIKDNAQSTLGLLYQAKN